MDKNKPGTRICSCHEIFTAEGFHIVGYGCTTCVGNSGDLDKVVSNAIEDNECSQIRKNNGMDWSTVLDVKAHYMKSSIPMTGNQPEFSETQAAAAEVNLIINNACVSMC